MGSAKVIFTKRKLRHFVKVSRGVLLNVEGNIGTEGRDFVNDELTIMMDSWFLERLSETRQLHYVCDRPKFLDWLLRRRKTAHFTLEVKDLLLNPPPSVANGTIRIYEVPEIN